MLSTLLKIGQWQSQGKSEWDRFLDIPRVESTDRHGNEIKNYILPIVFDLDLKTVIIDQGNLYEYDESILQKVMSLKILGRRNKAFYATSIPNKFIQVFKSLFGKPLNYDEEGELISIIENNYPTLVKSDLLKLLKSLSSLKKEMEGAIINSEGEIDLSKVKRQINLQTNERIVLITIKIKSNQYDLSYPKLLSEIDEYKEFLRLKYELVNDSFENSMQNENKLEKLCYATNKFEKDITELNLTTSFSLNKMFVTTTQNYLNGFHKGQNNRNYQVSLSSQKTLDVGSNYILKNLQAEIANIKHVIIPEFMENENIDLELALTTIKSKSEILFNLKRIKNFTNNISDEITKPYWLNFIAYDTNGNFFKSTEIIKDVSNFHFQKILQTFISIDWEYRENKNIEWSKIMTSYGKDGVFFNFNTIYQLIPLRKEKEKKNRALSLMKSILENRKIDKEAIYSNFCELCLCFYYERYQSYTNIKEFEKTPLYFNLRNATYKYLAFFDVLRKLKLIDMNEETNLSPAEMGNKYDESIKDFFEKMKLNDPQQAMFYLGRMLNSVEFIQKGKKKTVIDKVNFNGMDRDDIRRLRLSLLEKAKQYSKVGKVIFTDSKFGDLFHYNQWNMNPQEAVFFLMTGYSFGISTKDAKDLENAEIEENEGIEN